MERADPYWAFVQLQKRRSCRTTLDILVVCAAITLSASLPIISQASMFIFDSNARSFYSGMYIAYVLVAWVVILSLVGVCAYYGYCYWGKIKAIEKEIEDTRDPYLVAMVAKKRVENAKWNWQILGFLSAAFAILGILAFGASNGSSIGMSLLMFGIAILFAFGTVVSFRSMRRLKGRMAAGG